MHKKIITMFQLLLVLVQTTDNINVYFEEHSNVTKEIVLAMKIFNPQAIVIDKMQQSITESLSYALESCKNNIPSLSSKEKNKFELTDNLFNLIFNKTTIEKILASYGEIVPADQRNQILAIVECMKQCIDILIAKKAIPSLEGKMSFIVICNYMIESIKNLWSTQESDKNNTIDKFIDAIISIMDDLSSIMKQIRLEGKKLENTVFFENVDSHAHIKNLIELRQALFADCEKVMNKDTSYKTRFINAYNLTEFVIWGLHCMCSYTKGLYKPVNAYWDSFLFNIGWNFPKIVADAIFFAVPKNLISEFTKIIGNADKRTLENFSILEINDEKYFSSPEKYTDHINQEVYKKHGNTNYDSYTDIRSWIGLGIILCAILAAGTPLAYYLYSKRSKNENNV